VKTKKSGLTVVEILVVLGIIALLVGMLLPAVHTVQKMAKDTKQRAQLTAIELGLAAFKNDYGDYPPSEWWNPGGARQDYCGAQKLAEALLGWDLLGFHPDSAWNAGGVALDPLGNPIANTVYAALDTLTKRKDRYIDLDTANVFRLGQSALGDGLYPNTGQLAPHAYVLCDVFSVHGRKVLLGNGKTVSPGTPILYYKANPASKLFPDLSDPGGAVPEPMQSYIYNGRDNWPLLTLGRLAAVGKPFDPLRDAHPLEGRGVRPLEGMDGLPPVPKAFTGYNAFYWYIHDPKTRPSYWASRPDSYILISAGADGLYGTDDDIRNFGQ
jgi:type II secretory pathway pseudopilin PulG